MDLMPNPITVQAEYGPYAVPLPDRDTDRTRQLSPAD